MISSIQILLTTLTSFFITYFAIPPIIKVARLKNLFDYPDHRKKHVEITPTLGGIAIFAGFIISITFWSNQSQIIELQYIISSTLILFFMGMKDDIINLQAHKKLIGQIAASLIIVFYTNISINSFFGLFNIYQIPSFISSLSTIFIIIAITNSFNLIDGIDSLASSLAIVICLFFGTWFYLTNNLQFSIISFSMIGSMTAFYFYNKTPAKIFMGDTGSYLIGFIISILSIKFLELNRDFNGNTAYKIYSSPAVVSSILIIPLFDILRVFTARILNKKNPLKADRNHLHHIMIDSGLSHGASTNIILLLNIFLIILNLFICNKIRGELLILINLIYASLYSFYFINLKNSKHEKDINITNTNLIHYETETSQSRNYNSVL